MENGCTLPSQANVAHATSVRGSLQAQTGHYPRVRLYATARRTWHMPPAYGGHYKHRQGITPVYGYTPQPGERGTPHQHTGVTTSTDSALPPSTTIRHSQANVAHPTSIRGSLQAQTAHYPRVRLYATARRTWHTPPAYGGHYKHRQRITPEYDYMPQPGERGTPHQHTGVTTSTDSALPPCMAIHQPGERGTPHQRTGVTTSTDRALPPCMAIHQPGERGTPHQRTGVTTSKDRALPPCTTIRHSQVNVAHPTSIRGSLQAQTAHYPRVWLYTSQVNVAHPTSVRGALQAQTGHYPRVRLYATAR